MGGMSPKKSWIHLDRAELFAVFIVLMLSHGLLYVLGVLTGYGLNPEGSSHTAAIETVSGHEKKSVAKHSVESGRSPASVAAEEKADEPGRALRKAFKESKQQALNELSLRKTVAEGKPKSVVEMEAHFDSHSEWNRKPAMIDKAAEIPAEAADAKSVPTPTPPKEASTTRAVSGLFERRPSSVQKFEPRPGTFAVQLASYTTEDEAQAKVSELRKAGYDEAFIKTTLNNAGTTWYRVQVGSFPNKAWAQKTGEKIVRRQLAQDYIVRPVQ